MITHKNLPLAPPRIYIRANREQAAHIPLGNPKLFIFPNLIVSPLNVRLLGAHQPLSAGRRYDLLCQSAGSRPPAVITWWRDGQRLEKTTETVRIYK